MTSFDSSKSQCLVNSGSSVSAPSGWRFPAPLAARDKKAREAPRTHFEVRLISKDTLDSVVRR
jgi:hypothetical protein